MTSSVVEFLGQGGFKIELPGFTGYLDPYLSDSVREMDSPDLVRQVPIPVVPEDITDADCVLLTHAHIDHCDPHTLPKLAAASPGARFIGPSPVLAQLAHWGIAPERLMAAEEQWQELSTGVRVYAVPAAHPEVRRDAEGRPACVGFILEAPDGSRAYFAGDTGLTHELLELAAKLGPYDVAFLPCNEQNYFRASRGIVGNMTVREAFGFAQAIGARRLFPCHWDMFAANSVFPEEIKLLYEKMSPPFALEMGRCVALGQTRTLASIIIRTLNEAEHLEDLLTVIGGQKTDALEWEVIVVDSGSTDDTLQIAKRHDCRLVHITREEFSFGRSLNLGCEAALGDILVFISGHCVPAAEEWLERLCAPLRERRVAYVYGRQVGDDGNNFSERRIFTKYYPGHSRVPQDGFYCNNANAAMLKSAWQSVPFDEDLTGLEDLDAAKRLSQLGEKIGYVAEAAVFHHHDESWRTVRRRFQRESIALQKIMPEVHLSMLDVVRYVISSVLMDWRSALRHGHLWNAWFDILLYRINQYVGSYLGNNNHRKLSREQKESFFYPSTKKEDDLNGWLHSHRRLAPHEGE